MFKLIAVRPLKGCLSSILKCLKEGQMYYFCNDYSITDNGIELRDEYVKPLPDDFFSTEGGQQLQINVSAIVGRNGDGKSTLVELVMRLINNCAKHYHITDKDYLLRVEGVKAELYYEIDEIVYCIRERENDTFTGLWEYADTRANNGGHWDKKMTAVSDVSCLSQLFYTIVSNYSHYAYNTRDFREEWNTNLKVNKESEKCWLHYLFHKNDGYWAPIAVHPYREEGNIDINRETGLTMQRLMALYIQEPSPKENEHSFRRIGGKDAEILQLTDVGFSKLQETTLLQFFKESRSVSSLKGILDLIEELLEKYDDTKVEDLQDNKLEVVETCLDFLMGIGDAQYQVYLDKCLKWISKQKGVYSSKSDIRRLFNAIQKFNDTYKNVVTLPYNKLVSRFGKYCRLNVRQLIRLRYIYRVLQYWEFSTDILLKDYAVLTDIERCQHYIVYKTISICATYPDYRNALDEYDRGWNNVGLVFRDDIISEMVKRVKKDQTHITLKLRQCVEFIKRRGMDKENVFESLDFEPEPQKAKEMHKGNLWVKFDDLKEKFNEDPFPLQLLPPPIYKTVILYVAVNQSNEYIPYRFLSSGEKQLLNNFGALIYHLRNLDSVVNTGKRYENANIILEEIELYFHPEYQRQIVKMLIDKIRARDFNNLKRINITFVTHSPFILSDIPLCNVLYLGKEESSEVGNTFGANIYDLLRDSFFLTSDIGELAHSKIDEMIKLYHQADSENKRKTFEEKYDEFVFVHEHLGEAYLKKTYGYMLEQLQKQYKPKKAMEMWRQRLSELNKERDWLNTLLDNNESSQISN